jgi:hypothetical protein
MLLRRFPALTQDQRDILTGIAIRAIAETTATLAALACVLVVVWAVASVVVGSIEIGRWIGRIT